MIQRKSTLYVLALFFFITAPAFVASAQMSGSANCPYSNITDGVPVNLEGMVTAIGMPGAGMTIDTGEELVTVYGIGPVWFWKNSGVTRPEVGEQVSVTGYEVTLSDGSSRIVATEITVGGNTVVLRDAATGLPVWRNGGMQSGSGSMKRCVRMNRNCRQ